MHTTLPGLTRTAAPAMRSTPPLLAALAAALIPSLLAAQEVAGRVTMRGDSAVAGGLVELLDLSGRVLADAATDRAGRFRLRAPAAGTFRVRAGQVGFRSGWSEPFDLGAGERRDVSLSVERRAVTLEGIRARGRGRCEATSTGGEEVARVWDEARKALALTVRTAADSAVGYQFSNYARTTRVAGDSVLEDTTHTRAVIGAIPFSSAPVAELAESGFVRNVDGRTTFFGPDAQALLSQTFLAQHCFSLREGTGAEAGLIGLGFVPVATRRRPDVSGVLWLDAASSELRHLEWGYTRVRGATAQPPRGRADFVRLPTGAWIISRWWLRIPFARGWFDHQGRGSQLVYGRIDAVREVGGSVERVWAP